VNIAETVVPPSTMSKILGLLVRFNQSQALSQFEEKADASRTILERPAPLQMVLVSLVQRRKPPS